MHFCLAVTNYAETQVSIKPPLDKAAFKVGDAVCTVSLADLHEYIFMYRNIEILVGEARDYEAAAVLRTVSASLHLCFLLSRSPT
jgi:type IV secretory pathway ATPase VirB11/archaellum biosynthesis ATPase